MRISRAAFSLLLFPALGAAQGYISLAPASYPRALQLANGTAVATCEKADGSAPRIVLVASIAPNSSATWDLTSVVVEDTTGIDPDLANGFPLQLADGHLLVAYRHHTGPPSARVFRIAVSHSEDGGATWAPLSVVWEGGVGVWEPFLYVSPKGALRVAYSAELSNGGLQDIVQQESADGGATWGPRMLIAHTANSRNGMPGIAVAPDGSLIVVFEGFWTGVWGAFTVNCMRSFDDGVTWGQGEVVYAPAVGSGFNAGSPQVFVCPDSGRINVVFMTSAPALPGWGPSRLPARGAWPDNASIAISSTTLNPGDPSAPLNFTGVTPRYVQLLTPSAYWPSFLYAAGDLRIVYQDANDDAAQTAGVYCDA